MKHIKFTTTKRGTRAYYYSRSSMRWLPIAVKEAELLISTGKAFKVVDALPSGS